MKWWFKRPLWFQIAVCLVIGLALGFILGPKSSVIKPIGDIFLSLLKMLIVPLTFFAIAGGVTKMEDLRSLRSVGGLILIYYTATSAFAALVGAGVALVVKPGQEALGLLDAGKKVEAPAFDFIKNIVSWVPSNPIQSMANTDMLPIIIFAVLIGVCLLALGKKAQMVTDLVNQTGDVMLKLTEFVMAFAPYGILALVANMVGSLGASMLKEVGRFIITDYIGLIIISVVEYPLLLKLIGKLSPARFYRNVAPVMLVAASTTSSNATLPAGMNAAQEAEGVPEKVYGFTLPLGATVNMDGMANAIGVIAVFACNLYGMKISPALIFEFVFLGLVLSTGCAGVKGAGIVMSGVLLQTLGMPLTLLPVLAAVWPILDIGHTTMNVAGDHVGTCIVANRLGMLDQDVFYGRKQASTKTA